tara:strand:- start:98 stop:427 length:330 start_codon:yes stop_codon:yes gene_type:complete
MAIYNPPNLTSGMDQLIVGTITAVPEFTSFFLVFVYLMMLIGGSTAQKRRIGSADLPMWSTLASLTTLLVALPLTLTLGLIQIEVLSAVVIVTIFSGIWLFLDRNRNEV